MNLHLHIHPLIKTTWVVIFALLMASCSLEHSDDASLKVAQDFIAALEVRDANQAIERLDETAVLEVPYPLAEGENIYGSRKMWGEPLREYIHGIVQRNSRISFNNSVWYTAGDGVIFLECDGDLIRSKDGARYQNKYIILFKIEDSKIILWREYYNPITAATTFGIPLESIPTSISP